MTTEERSKHIERILSLAGCVVLETPAKRAKYCTRAYVSWELIEQLKKAFEDAGYDMDGARKRLKQVAA